jgi:cell wall-associated NlpC family hydrolase
MYKYLDSSCSALGDVLDMTSKEAQAKGQMLKKGVDIFKNRAVEEQRAEDERHEAELKELQRQRELNKDAKPVSMNGGQVANGHISLEDSNSRSLGQGGGGSSGGARTPGSSAGGSGTCSSAQVEKAVQAAISIANSGCSYQMGGEGPDVYDCTGFISTAFSQAGWPIDVCHAGAFDNGFLSMGFVSIPYSDGNEDQLQRGDILVNNHHVELYIGGGQFAGAHSTASGVSVCSYFDNDWEEIYRFKG